MIFEYIFIGQIRQGCRRGGIMVTEIRTQLWSYKPEELREMHKLCLFDCCLKYHKSYKKLQDSIKFLR